jgi:nijmegen breakage syndrome protein 1
VFTFSFTSKEKKANPYQTLYNRLGPLDIKAVDDYKCGLTTHVVAKKRNTAKGLQALIDGKYIVHNDTFINAVIAAAHPSDNGGAPLEEDFEGNWPDERQFLPPKGEEPTTRHDDAYAPNHDRQGMFDGYTFVFYARTQFDTLLAPITNGRGKALFREVVPNETTVDEFVRYVKGVAGEKGLGEFEDGSVGRGVVVVRFNPVAGDSTHWYAEFGREVALKLDQRLVEQNEFLDVILGSNASVLRRPLDFISSAIEEPPPATGKSHKL